MYEYKIQLDFKIESCINCPFRNEIIIHENVQSQDLLSGIFDISRRKSHCMLRNEPIATSETVEGYNSKCPLKGKVFHLDNKN